MKYLMILVFLIKCLVINCRTAINPDKILENLADSAFASICQQIDSDISGLKTIIIPFRGYKDYQSQDILEYQTEYNYDERHFEDLLYERMIMSKRFKLYTRNKLEQALEELKLQHSDLFDWATAKEIGNFIGSDIIIILEGNIGAQNKLNIKSRSYDDFGENPSYDLESWFVAKIYVIDIETGEIIAFWYKKKKFN
ncbi:MAG: hypothetical protein JW870_11160 [Candidatus Delongbacteria bacterium]|nr:hypothetical protein [Candidatus Delongbacteria bacterium]